MNKQRWGAVAIVAVAAAALTWGAAPTVTKYQAPGLLEEINTALASLYNGTFGGTATFTGAATNASASVIGYESSTASLILDADQGDDNADTWTIVSELDNDLSFVNHTAERFKCSAAGVLQVAGLTASLPVWTDASKNIVSISAAAARTNLSLVVGANVQAYDADLAAVAGKTISFITLTNLVYNGGTTTGNVNVVRWQ